MITAKVVIELRFTRDRMPKSFLESIVKDISKYKDQLIAQYKLTDPDAYVQVHYEDYTVPEVRVIDLIPKPDFRRVFRRKKHLKSPDKNKGVGD